MPLVNQRPLQSLPTPIAAPAAVPEHSALDTTAAAFSLNNIATGITERYGAEIWDTSPIGLTRSTSRILRDNAQLDAARDPTYDPLDDLDGFEPHWRRLIGSESPQESAMIKQRIAHEQNAQQILSESGGWGHAASFAAGAVDPATLVSMAIPGGAGLKGGRMVAAMVGTNAALDTAFEVTQHQLQETRTVNESLLNIGAGTLLTGVFGSIAARVPKAEMQALRDAVGEDLHGVPVNTSGSTVGAAAVGGNTTLEQEGIAGVGEAIGKTAGRISMLTRTMTAQSKMARQVVQDLAEVPYAVTKNAEGIETPVAVETLSSQGKDAMTYRVVTEMQDSYKAYRDNINRSPNVKPLSDTDFATEVGRAMRREDAHAVPEVARAAAAARKYIIDPLTKRLQKAGLLIDPVEVAQKQLDEQVVSDYYSMELRRITEKFIQSGGDGTEDLAIASIKKIRADAEAELAAAPTNLKGLDRVHYGQKIIAARDAELSKIEPSLLKRLDDRAKGVFEGRHLDANEQVTDIAALMDRRKNNKIIDVDVPRKKTDVTGFEVIGAKSYLPRLYDHVRIKANLVQFKNDLIDWYVTNGVDRAEAMDIADTVQHTILGTTRGFISLGNDLARVVKAGPLQGRTLNVPDEVLEPYLVNNAEVVLSRYVHSVLPQLEMQNKFGSLTLKDNIEAIRSDYAILQAATTSKKEQAKLVKEFERVASDIAEMRDRVLGQAGIPADPESKVIRGMRSFRDYNYVRLLGGQVLSSIADAGRIVSMHGLVKTGKAMATFATDLNQWKLARDEAKRLGVGLDWTLNTRGQSFGDIGEFATSRLEDYSKRITGNFNKITLMATWNSSMKMLSASLQQDELLRLAGSSAVSKRNIEVMAGLGINLDMLERIGKEFDTHGATEGLRRARSELWKDTEAARVFEAAIFKASNIAVLTKGVGDTPAFMSNEMAKTIFQFKSFGMAAVNRLIIPMAQGLQRRDVAYINGMSLMLSLGVMRYVAKQWTADKPVELTPGTVVREAIDGSGFASYMVDVYDPISALSGDRLPRFSRYSDRDPVETALGPTLGTATDLFQTARGLATDGAQRGDIHQVRKLAPWQNVFYLRRGINYLEDATADTAGVQ